MEQRNNSITVVSLQLANLAVREQSKGNESNDSGPAADECENIAVVVLAKQGRTGPATEVLVKCVR